MESMESEGTTTGSFNGAIWRGEPIERIGNDTANNTKRIENNHSNEEPFLRLLHFGSLHARSCRRTFRFAKIRALLTSSLWSIINMSIMQSSYSAKPRLQPPPKNCEHNAGQWCAVQFGQCEWTADTAPSHCHTLPNLSICGCVRFKSQNWMIYDFVVVPSIGFRIEFIMSTIENKILYFVTFHWNATCEWLTRSIRFAFFFFLFVSDEFSCARRTRRKKLCRGDWWKKICQRKIFITRYDSQRTVKRNRVFSLAGAMRFTLPDLTVGVMMKWSEPVHGFELKCAARSDGWWIERGGFLQNSLGIVGIIFVSDASVVDNFQFD